MLLPPCEVWSRVFGAWLAFAFVATCGLACGDQRIERAIDQLSLTDDPETREAAIAYLADRKEQALPLLREALREADSPYLAYGAADALQRMGGIGFSALAEALESGDLRVRGLAVERLMASSPDLSTKSPPVLLALVDLLEIEKSASIRGNICVALGSSDSEDARVHAALVQALLDPEEHVRRDAREAFHRLDSLGVPQLLSALDSGSTGGELVIEVLRTMARLPLATRMTLGKAVSAKLSHENEHVRAEAARVLGDLGRGARQQLGPLATLLRDRDDSVRKAADASLQRLEGSAYEDPSSLWWVLPYIYLREIALFYGFCLLLAAAVARSLESWERQDRAVIGGLILALIPALAAGCLAHRILTLPWAIYYSPSFTSPFIGSVVTIPTQASLAVMAFSYFGSSTTFLLFLACCRRVRSARPSPPSRPDGPCPDPN